MDLIFIVAMLCLLAYVVYRNVSLFTRYRHNKEYIECYKDMINNKEGAYERTCKFIEEEKSEEYKNKGRILKLYMDMEKGLDSNETLKDLDLQTIFLKKGKYTKQQIALNSDIFVWIYLDLARARRLSKFDVLNTLGEGLKTISQLENRVEYQTALAIYNALMEKEDAGVGFLTSLLDGGFATYEYEKNLINLYKRFAAATLAYAGEPMEDYYKDDLHDFAKSQIGAAYMKDLEIYDKYPPRIESDKVEETLASMEDDKKSIEQVETK